MSIPTFLRWAAPIVACLLPYWGACQIPAPPNNIQSPNAAGFASYGDIPVSPFTGKPDISINLHNLADGHVQIPITLSYDPSGVKPDVHPGWTGLNFSLSTTYAITRQVKDWPDDCPNYGSIAQEGWFFHSATLGATDWTTATKMENNTDLSILNDLEPDEYSFSLPGLSGKFYYGHDQKWKISCDRPITIKFIGTSATVRPPFTVPEFISGGGNPWQSLDGGYMRHMQGFIITDEFGTEYTFGGGDPAYSEYSIDFFAQGKSTWFCNNWYLKSIKRQTGQTINFTYERGPFVAQMNFSVVNKKYQVGGTGGFLNTDCSSSSSIMPLSGPYAGKLISPIYLKEISAANFKVKFEATTSTELRYTDEIFSQFVNAYMAAPTNGRMQDILTFLYSCFYPTYSGCDASGETLSSLLGKLQWKKLDKIQIQNGGGTTIKEYLLTYNNVTTERLMLTKIQEKSGYNADVLPPYEFSYYTATGLTLPGYGKSHTDHWGYNNGVLINQATDFSSVSTYGATFRSVPTDRKHYLLGSLTQIKYPTGGVTKFKFEPHTFKKEVKLKRWEGTDLFSTNQTAGGLRIKEIHTSDPVNHTITDSPVPTVIKRYYYINGFNAASPDTTTLPSSGILGGKSQYWWPDYAPRPKGSFSYIQQVFSTQSVLPETENSMGMHVGYSEVVENSSTGGWTVYTFSNFDNGYPDEAALGYLQTTTTAYEPYNSNAFKRGKLLYRKVYFQNGNLAQRVETKYDTVGVQSDALVRSFKSLKTALCSPSGNYVYEGTAYTINTQKFLPYEEIVYTHDQDVATRSAFSSRRTTYKANGQIAAVYQTDSRTDPAIIPGTPQKGPRYDRQISTAYKYANDYTNPSNDAISIDMTGRNMISAPIEITKSRVNVSAVGPSISSTQLNWQKVTYNSNRLPAKVETTLGTGVAVTEYEFLTYDARGNLLTYKDKSGTTTKLEYYGTGDVGKVDLVKSRTTADGSTIPQTTAYDYKPLVGVSKITDPNSKAIDYEYDNFNRLSFVKSSGSARQSYCYNYAGQLTNCTDLAPFGSTAANTPALIPDDALPVTLVEFTARKVEQTALLQWASTTESNSKLFEIQRSDDGRNWIVIGSVNAKGESSELQRYSFTDMTPLISKSKQKPSENLYRLKMIDFDDTFAYSRIQSLVFEDANAVSLFPNPVTVGGNINIAIDDISSIKAIKIYDASGRMVHQSAATKKISTNIMAAGIYVVEITYKDGSITTHRIVKQ